MTARRKEIPDSGKGAVRGLYEIVQPSGKRSWAYRYRFGGKPTKFTIGPSPEIDRKQARLICMEAIVARAHDVDPADQRREIRAANRNRPVSTDRIETVAGQFLKRHCANLKPATQAEAGRYLAKFIKAWPGRALSSISKPMIHDLLDQIKDGGSPIAANRTLAWLNSFFNFAIQRSIVAVNPCTGIARPSTETARARILTDEELTAVLKAASGLEAPYGAFVHLLALTGQRRNEVSNLCWSEIDFAAKVWTLPAARAKNGHEHVIPLSDPAIAILTALPRFEGCDFVFTLAGAGPINGHDQTKKALDKAAPDVTGWTYHDIRRTFASGLARLLVGLPVIEKILNHTGGSFAGIVGVYQRHSFLKEMRAAMDVWARHIEGLMTGKADNVVTMRGRS